MESPVAYLCTAPSHQVGDGGPDKLTVHDGQWAFCPFDARREGHVWTPTGGLPLFALKRTAAVRKVEIKEGGRV